MAKAMLVNHKERALSLCEKQIPKTFPGHEISGLALTVEEALRAIEEKAPDILVIGIEDPGNSQTNLLHHLSQSGFTMIIATKDQNIWPRIELQRFPPRLIGIPTIKGMDFFPVEDIIRCEGFNRCTRIFTKGHPALVSAYNLGEFVRLLRPYSFFSPHRSHLINLRHVKSYNREGTIVMGDNSSVPVSRQKKAAFLDTMVHV